MPSDQDTAGLGRRAYIAATSAFADGSDSPRAFLERCIEVIEAQEERVGAFAATNFEGARAAADAAGERWKAGKTLSPIDGMPIGIKDIMETAHMPTGQGSPLFTGWDGKRDCAAVAALRAAGAVVVAKTVTTEFASSHPSTTRNPWDTTRTPGGSSSGSAASVGIGMLPAALGTQVIGSIIRPAGYCGAYGYKPSVGGINRGGSFDDFSQSCSGVLAATLADTWTVARAISLRAGGDPGYVGLTGPIDLPAAKKPKRIAFLETAGWPTATDAAKQAINDARDKLKAADIDVVDKSSSDAVAAAEKAIAGARELSMEINAWEGHWPLNTYANDMDKSKLSTSAVGRLEEAQGMSQEQYAGLIAERAKVRAIYEALSAHVDACMTLSAPGAAPVGLDWTGDPIFTVPTSLLGCPSLTMPVFEDDGMPLGLQLMGFTDQDADLFATAGSIQSELA
ncbi:MAG: amidase [Rhodospirillaceae bacterium]|jgi:Asp-tRNA(Asn)/Glu-tRNA(Gln) amidotransferase A subunit family amidase|nr:amidase [Rhodospirillaceae bacterium]MBT5459731.1 amidase [Rhodospirillaceae bacterium]